MQSRDIVLANLEHRLSPRPAFNFTGPNQLNDMIGIGLPSPNPLKRWRSGSTEYYTDDYGNIWHRMVGGSVKGEIYQPILASWDDLPNITMPDYTQPSLYHDMTELFAQPTSKFKVAYIGGWIFDNARYMRRLDNYLMDMLLEPDLIMELNTRIASVYQAKITRVAQAGADAIMVGEDLGTQTGPLFGPHLYEKLLYPTYKRLVDHAHNLGMKVLMHACGQNTQLLEWMIRVGFDAFQFDQPAIYDYSTLHSLFKRHKRALFSPVDIQQVLPTGDRAYIEAETERMVRSFEGFLIVKNYPDLPGIGVQDQWNQWAYDKLLQLSNYNGSETGHAS